MVVLRTCNAGVAGSSPVSGSCNNLLKGAASIKVMLLAFTQENTGQYRGGLRGRIRRLCRNYRKGNC